MVERSDGAILAFERADAPGKLAAAARRHRGRRGTRGHRVARAQGGDRATASDVELVVRHPDWVPYEWPADVAAGRKGIGQIQRWFTFRVHDDAVEPTPDGSEFTAWKWVKPEWMIRNVVGFRRPAYERVLGNA